MTTSFFHPVRALAVTFAAMLLIVSGCATAQDIMLANERILTHRERLENGIRMHNMMRRSRTSRKGLPISAIRCAMKTIR